MGEPVTGAYLPALRFLDARRGEAALDFVGGELWVCFRHPDGQFVTERKATPQEVKDLLFSWYVDMNVRSNGVVLSKNNATIGVGTGQQDRVTAVRLALEKAAMRGHSDEVPGSVLASDGFFPFRDSIDLLAEHGVTACVQPGGSVKDKEVIEACNENGIAMAFTDERCFRHF